MIAPFVLNHRGLAMTTGLASDGIYPDGSVTSDCPIDLNSEFHCDLRQQRCFVCTCSHSLARRMHHMLNTNHYGHGLIESVW